MNRNTAHYRGDHSGIVQRGETMGPDRDGAFYRPISASYDDRSDLTLVEFRFVPLDELIGGAS